MMKSPPFLPSPPSFTHLLSFLILLPLIIPRNPPSSAYIILSPITVRVTPRAINLPIAHINHPQRRLLLRAAPRRTSLRNRYVKNPVRIRQLGRPPLYGRATLGFELLDGGLDLGVREEVGVGGRWRRRAACGFVVAELAALRGALLWGWGWEGFGSCGASLHEFHGEETGRGARLGRGWRHCRMWFLRVLGAECVGFA